MFCEKCGHNNLDGAKFCAGCGAQLTAPRLDKAPFEETPSTTNGYAQPEYTQPAYTQPESAQPQYNQPTYQQPESVQPQYQYTQPQYGQQPSYNNYNNYNSYQPKPAVKPQGKSVGAVVLYMISGAIALLSILFVFLPHITVLGSGYAPFQLVSDRYIWGSSSDARAGAVVVVILLVIPMLLQLVWAILSFLRTRAAGVLGLIASIFAINHTIVWIALLGSIREKSYSLASVTAVPVLMLVLAIAGMVLAIIQLTKKNRVR